MVLRSLHLRRIVDQTNGFNLWMILMKMIATRNLALANCSNRVFINKIVKYSIKLRVCLLHWSPTNIFQILS